MRWAPWIGLLVVGVALATVAWQLASTRTEVAALRNWQGAMLQQLESAGGAGATAEHNPVTPDAATEALARIVAARDGALLMATAPPAGDGAVPAPAGANPTDESEISRLNQTQSTGSAAGDARIIEQDSQAAWKGWQ